VGTDCKSAPASGLQIRASLRVADASGNTAGYVPNTGQYLYDANGNMRYDPSKKITVSYNPLNLPRLVEFDNDDNITYTYTATGTKLRKTVTSWKTTTGGTTDYAGQFLYQDNELSCIFTPVGRIVPMQINDETFWKHEYNLKDHLGNTRIVFAAHPHGQPEVMQQTSYYPFGMTLQQQNFGGVQSQPNKLLYNGKELQDDELAGVSLDWYDYGARFYDAALGRWHVFDPMAHEREWLTPYNFVSNNPIMRIDPTGALDNPIYDEDGDFLGTDDKGLHGEAIVMNLDDFKQGMSHEDALDKGTLRSDMPLVTSPIIFDKIDNHFAGLSSRPDYDGFVTIDEGIEWAKQRPNTLGNNDPNDALYLDASKLNFGDLSVDNIGLKQGQQGNVNLFDYVHWTSSSSRATTYALGNTQMKLLNPNAGTVKLFSDIYDWDYHNNPPSGTRDRLIQAERWRSGVNSSHGFRVFMYGTGTIKK
jgi:RHS repeat-associated protein